MINNIKGFYKINKYNTVKFIIVYICEPLINKASGDSLTGVFPSEARLAGMEEIVFVEVQEEVFINMLFRWFR